MRGFLDIRTTGSSRVFALEADRYTIGKAETNDIALAQDASISRLHAVLERYGNEWAVRDLGSTNGTFVNGDRILGERRLGHGDEIRLGNTIVLYKVEAPSPDDTRTQTAEPPPELTRREREVLVALCRPVLSGAMFTRPATIREIAQELVVTENAVKQHLGRLYDKFEIYGGPDPRPLALANEAIRRGAVSLADLRATS